jgi:hypothetical protein
MDRAEPGRELVLEFADRKFGNVKITLELAPIDTGHSSKSKHTVRIDW